MCSKWTLPVTSENWDIPLNVSAQANLTVACRPGNFQGWHSWSRVWIVAMYCLSASRGSRCIKSSTIKTQNQYSVKQKWKNTCKILPICYWSITKLLKQFIPLHNVTSGKAASITFTILCPLFQKADIKAVKESHEKRQVHAIQRAISFHCYLLQVTYEEQSVILTQGWLTGPDKETFSQGLSAFFNEIRNLYKTNKKPNKN